MYNFGDLEMVNVGMLNKYAIHLTPLNSPQVIRNVWVTLDYGDSDD